MDASSVAKVFFGIVIGFFFSFLYSEEHAIKLQNLISKENSGNPGTFSIISSGDLIVESISKNVRILCWIMTMKGNHDSKAKHIKATWAKRCNKYIFISTENDSNLSAIKLNVSDGYENLWGKTKGAFKYVYHNYKNDYDWFLKADDDTYVIVENLRYLLLPQNASEPVWYGTRFKQLKPQGFMSGGAGYVLSREALRLFVEEAMPNATLCTQSSQGNEDVEISKCLYKVGVRFGDSRDARGRSRFFPFAPEFHVVPGAIDPTYDWYYKSSQYPHKKGPECCSDYAISFHYTSPNLMYVLDYLIYRLKPFGLNMHFIQPTSQTRAKFNLIDNEDDVIRIMKELADRNRGANDTLDYFV